MADYGICCAPGCDKPAYIKSSRLCVMHANRLRRGGTLDRRRPTLTLDQLLDGRRQFGDWTVVREVEPYRRKDNGAPMRKVLCQCSCGNTAEVAAHKLKAGGTKQCGCKMPEICVTTHRTHGDAGRAKVAPEYRAWHHMLGRCLNPNDGSFDEYGGRGITVCERWRESYEAFLSDMGRRPQGRSLDRINVNGNYEPDNCRWATAREQAQNVRHNVRVVFRGQDMVLKEACRQAGIEGRYKAVHQRMRIAGQTFAQAMAKEGIEVQCYEIPVFE